MSINFTGDVTFKNKLFTLMGLNEASGKTSNTPYVLSWANTANSGWSFGYIQYDLSTGNADGNDLFKDILRNAVDSAGNYIIDDGDPTTGRLDDKLVAALCNQAKTKNGQGLSSAEQSLISSALSSTYGMREINGNVDGALQKLIDFADKVKVAASPSDQAFLQSDLARLFLCDYGNEFGVNGTGWLNFVQGSSFNGYQKNGALGVDDLLGGYFRTAEAQKDQYLASPPLVVAYALAGTVNIDLTTEPIGTGRDGPVYLKDIWPTSQEVAELVETSLDRGMFKERYASVFEGSQLWKDIKVSGGELFQWDDASTYIHHPPFFQDMTLDIPSIKNILGARVLVLMGDSITTDHISPAGNIAIDSPAGLYLQGRDVQPRDFNSYGARRGNDQVMLRGTFANVRLKNLLAGGKEGWFTRYFELGNDGLTVEQTTIFEAATKYQTQGIPTIVIAGKEYGTGSSRDWGAKGPLLLGVRAAIVESFERIHRSNLVGMGILPLCFMNGQNAETLGLDGSEVYNIEGLSDAMLPKSVVTVKAKKADGSVVEFKAVAQLNTSVEVNYYRNGGILQTVLRNLVK